MIKYLCEGKQAFSGPLIDQNGNWLHYVSFVNRHEFDYLVDHELYNLEGQAAFSQSGKVEFPLNDDTNYGAIEVKLAWKELTPAEVASRRFLTRSLQVVEYRPAPCAATGEAPPPAHVSGRTTDNGGNPPNQTKTVGLVGMHISMRTRSSPQWIWATFEQIDNTRLDPASGDARHPLPSHPSLANPDNPDALVTANVLPGYNGSSCNSQPPNDWDESKKLPPVETLRLVPPPQGTDQVNKLAQAFLGSRDSILRYYELDGTQWPKHPKAPAVPGGHGSAPESIIRKIPGEMVPVYLTNATMETYFQKAFQQAGPLEQDDRLSSQFSVDTTMVFGTRAAWAVIIRPVFVSAFAETRLETSCVMPAGTKSRFSAKTVMMASPATLISVGCSNWKPNPKNRSSRRSILAGSFPGWALLLKLITKPSKERTHGLSTRCR